jgi:CRP/FNR family transcriptional regulator
VVDPDVDDALARSFLADLPAELTGRLQAEGERADYPAGTTVYRAGDDPRAALVVRGLIRVYLSSPGGRQITVRYARPGDVLGIAVLVGGPAGTGVQTVDPSSVLRISARILTEAARSDARVAWLIAEELNRRLYEVLEQTAVNAFGSVRQRVATHRSISPPTGSSLVTAWWPPCRSRNWRMRPGRSARWWPGRCAICGRPGSWLPRQTAS